MSAPVGPPPAIGAGDHVRGSGPEAIVYFDLGCPGCAAIWRAINELELRLCARHFPIEPKHPRAPALHAAAEAAALQRPGAFWEMCESIYLDQGHQDDPHLWSRARELGLDLERFERDRRSGAVARRVRRDVDSALAAGLVATPVAHCAGEWMSADLPTRLADVAAAARGGAPGGPV